MRQFLFFPVVLATCILAIEGIVILGCPILTLIMLSLTSLFHNYSSSDYLQPTVLAFLAYQSMPLTIHWLKTQSILWKFFKILNIETGSLTELQDFIDGTSNLLNLNNFITMIQLSFVLGVVLLASAGILSEILELFKKKQL